MHFRSWFLRAAVGVAWLAWGGPAGAQPVVVLERGANHNVVQRVSVGRDVARGAGPGTSTYIQLEDGLNYWDEREGQWKESVEVIEMAARGAVALRGQHRAIFSSNANDPAGALDLEIRNSVRLRSSVLALRYFDAATGGTVILGTVRDVVGELLPPNQVIYRNVFDEVRADLVYTYRRRGVEADVVLREVPPGPEEFGLIPETTRLEVVTEFFDPPQPERRERLLASLEDPQLREGVAEPDWIDEELDFGVGRIGEGRAFAWSAREAAQRRPEDFAAVGKRWLQTEDGRTLLIESVDYIGLFEELLELPGTAHRTEALRGRAQQWAGRATADVRDEALREHGAMGRGGAGRWDGSPRSWAGSDWALLRRPPTVASAIEGGMRMAAKDGGAEPGLVLDWNTLTTGSVNVTFAATNTYYVTGNCVFTGTTTLEGGTVIKFPANGGTFTSVTIQGPLLCRTSAYRPAVFTAESDNTVGETIVAGTPDPSVDFGWRQLRFSNTGAPVLVEHLRFKHAYEGIFFEGNNPDNEVRHSQFVNCRQPVSNTATSPVRLRNVLVHGGKNSGAVFAGAGTSFAGEHLTIHQFPNLLSGGSLILTNSIVASVASVQAYSGSGNWQVASAAGLFDGVGAGSFYLPAFSPLRNAGATGIHPTLQQDLRQLTTEAPLVLGGNFGQETRLVVRARRDTDQPDIGYHYPPLDYAVSGKTLSEGTLRMTDGVALAVYGASGLVLGPGARFESMGSAAAPNRIAYFTQVQEQTASAWVIPEGDLGLMELAGTGVGAVPEIRWVFTEAWMPNGPANRRQWIRQSTAGGYALRTAHAQLRGLSLGVIGNWPGVSLSITNTLFEDVELRVAQSAAGGFHPVGLQGYNNLFRGGTLALTNSRVDSPWVLRDNLFDSLGFSVSGLNGTFSHNGFRAGLTTFGFSNRTGLVMDYVEGPQGRFAYPTLGTSPSLASLLDAGSRPASVAGLSPFSLRSDGVLEQDSMVDVGFHYPAAAPSPPGLIGHWRFDESSGTTATDSSPNGFSGTLINGPNWGPGHIGNGLYFDGINDQVQVQDAPGLRLTTPFTVAFWSKKHAENADFTLYVGKGDPIHRNFAIWDVAGASGKLLFQYRSEGGTYHSFTSKTELVIDRWYHVTCTWDGAMGRIYIDGQLDAFGAMTGLPLTSADPLVMGYAGFHGRFAGVLDEVCILGRAVGESEVPGLMQSSLSGPHRESLVGDWRFNQSSGAVAEDSSGLGVHGQLNNGPQWTLGRFGNGLTFNGVDDVLTVPNAPVLQLTSGLTIAFWINKASEPNDFVRIVGKGGPTARNFGVWDIAGPSRRVMFQFRVEGGAYRTVSSKRDVEPGVWRHVAATWDGATGRIYVDGVLDASGSMAGPPLTSDEPLTVGFAGYHTYYAGKLDEVVVLDRAASATEVAALVTHGVPVAGMPGVVAAWSFNQSSGSAVLDGSGNGLHGTLSPGPQWSAGQVGNALRFDGLFDTVSIADHPRLRLTDAFTVAFWVRKDSENPDFVRYVGKGNPTARNFGVWDASGASGRLLLQFRNPGGAYQTVASRGSVPVGAWRHVACSWDGTTGRIFLNGALDSSGPMAGPPATSADPVTVGYAGYHGRFHGTLDDVRIFNTALTEHEVVSLMRSTPADSDGDGIGDASEDGNGDGVRDAGESSWVDADSDYDGRSDAEERADGTDPADARSVKPVRLGLWNFDNAADPWRGDNGSVPWERDGVGWVELAPFVYGAELDSAGATLRYRDVEANGRANINALQGTVRMHYFPYWASPAPDCGPGTAGTGPGSTVELLSVGDFSIAIDSQGTNLMLRSPHPNGGWITHAQAKFRACVGEYLPDFPMDIQVSYATNASAIFVDGKLVARGTGIPAAPNRGSRAHGMFVGSGPNRNHQAMGIVDALFTYNVPLDLCTNALSMSVEVSQSPPSVTLTWNAVTNCYYLIERRSPPESAWQRIASVTPPSYTDATILPGQVYEYRLKADAGIPEEFRLATDPGHLTMSSGVRLPAEDAPGHILLVVDRTLTNNTVYANLLNDLTRDLSAEGWVVARYGAARHDDVTWANNPPRIAELKNWITAYRNANPNQAKAVFLFGHVPIPRSGMLSPDGHSYRPLPADGHYGDLDGVWTDTMNWPLAPGIEVPNVPGDGIFDQELIPPNAAGIAAVELAVGRVDFANMPTFASATPSRGELELLVQYVTKTRRYRRAEVTLPERAIYGAYFSSNAVTEASDRLGQHLAKLGNRLGTAVVGTNASGSVKADFFTAGLPAVWGIQGGYAGGYHLIHSRGPVNAYHGIVPHQTADLVLDAAEPPIAFSLVEASWMPEWNQADHLGRALLSTRNYGYAWSYAGATRIEWQYPVMTLGRTLGDGWMKTQNDAWMWPLGSVTFQSVYGTGVRVYLGVPSQGGYVFATLLGDPTLRQAPPRPTGTLTAQVVGGGELAFNWAPSPEPGAQYHFYRSTGGLGSAWTRLTTVPLTSPGYTDASPPPGAPVYMVRSMALREVASGSLTNVSAGSLWP